MIQVKSQDVIKTLTLLIIIGLAISCNTNSNVDTSIVLDLKSSGIFTLTDALTVGKITYLDGLNINHILRGDEDSDGNLYLMNMDDDGHLITLLKYDKSGNLLIEKENDPLLPNFWYLKSIRCNDNKVFLLNSVRSQLITLDEDLNYLRSRHYEYMDGDDFEFDDESILIANGTNEEKISPFHEYYILDTTNNSIRGFSEVPQFTRYFNTDQPKYFASKDQILFYSMYNDLLYTFSKEDIKEQKMFWPFLEEKQNVFEKIEKYQDPSLVVEGFFEYLNNPKFVHAMKNIVEFNEFLIFIYPYKKNLNLSFYNQTNGKTKTLKMPLKTDWSNTACYLNDQDSMTIIHSQGNKVRTALEGYDDLPKIDPDLEYNAFVIKISLAELVKKYGPH